MRCFYLFLPLIPISGTQVLKHQPNMKNYSVKLRWLLAFTLHQQTTHTPWRHQMETFSALLTICAGNSPVTGEFPAQRLVSRSFDVFFDLRLNKRLSKQLWDWWFETLSHLLWRHCNTSHFTGLCCGFYGTRRVTPPSLACLGIATDWENQTWLIWTNKSHESIKHCWYKWNIITNMSIIN